MALVVKDRVRETTATTGTGTLTLGGAVSGFQDFSVIGNGNTTYYAIVDAATGSWEVGLGTYTSSGTTLSRDTVLESSNNGNLVPFLSGTKDVFCTYPAERSVYADGTSIASPAANLTANRVMYATSTSAMGQSANLTFDGTTLTANTLTVSTGATTVPAGTVSAPAITTSGDTNTGIYFPAADTIAFTEGGVESMRIDSSGRLLIGTTASRANPVTSGSRLQIEDTSSGASPAFVRNTADTIASYVVLGKSRGTTVGSFNAVTSGDQVGGVSFEGADGTALVEAARVQGFVDGTVSTGVVPGRLAFYTASSAGSLTERLRLDSSGNLGLGVTPSAWRSGALSYDVARSSYADDNGTLTIASNAYRATSNWIYKVSTFATRMDSDSGQFRWYTTASGTAGNAISWTQAMTLDASGNLGIGTTSPDGGLDVEKQNSYFGDTTNGGRLYFRRGVDGSAVGRVGWISGSNVNFEIANDSGSGNILFQTNSAVRMTLDSSGNLGLGVTPSAYSGLTAGRLEVGAVGNSLFSNGSTNFWLTTNTNYETGPGYKYATTGVATMYLQTAGQHQWHRAASGTAGNAITFTQAMTLDASGRLFVGTTSGTNGFNLNSGGSPWMDVRASSTSASYATFYRGGTSTVAGYIGTDGGGIAGGGTGTAFGIRSEADLLFMSGSTERARITSDGLFQFNSGYGSVATAYGCRAWVNFDGTSNTANLSGTYSQSGTTVTVTATAHGLIAGNVVYSDITTGTAVDGTYTVATVISSNQFTYTAGTSLTTSGNITLRRNTIRGSGNVSSVADNATGDYAVNFSTAMPDTNFGWTTGSVNAAIVTGTTATVKTTSSIQFTTVRSSTGATQDSAEFCVAIFR